MIEEKLARNHYDIIPELSQRWSPRAFADRPVEPEKLLRVFEAARWAPSSRNEQPWRFLVARKGEEHYEKLFAGLNEFNQKWAWTAPVVGATLVSRFFDRNQKDNFYRYHDLGLAMGNLLAQATHEGLHLHQMAGIDKNVVAENMAVDTESFEVATMFVVGYQDESRLEELEDRHRDSEYKKRERKPLSEILFAGRPGQNPDWLK